MKKYLMTSLFLSAISFAQADNSADHAQLRPDSTVTPVKEVTTIQSPAKSLPTATIIDSKLDLEDTMKRMGRNFKKLKSVEGDLAAMKEPAAELAKWAGQAEALGYQGKDNQPASVEQTEKYVQGMQTLRKQLADLEVAIENNDVDAAQILINEMGNTRKQGHKYFEVN